MAIVLKSKTLVNNGVALYITDTGVVDKVELITKPTEIDLYTGIAYILFIKLGG